MSQKSKKKKQPVKQNTTAAVLVTVIGILLIVAIVAGVVYLSVRAFKRANAPIDMDKADTARLDAVDYVTNFVQIELTCGATMVVELYPDIAPITVANFQKLVSDHYYDGIGFHRVIEDFMIQAGDPTGTGMGGATETIKGEFSANGVENSLAHTRGVISMARKSNDMDSASSQFFIVHSETYRSSLDGQYAAFGKLVYGFGTLDAIAEVETATNTVNGISVDDNPVKPIRIKTMSFVEYQK